ncbi:MAG: NAD(P)/FAD-dependent oxidoreductase [Anaerolineae bacterium]|nr:NAD(P)/FAD-dependent oxidoreductase [Anaerolineae bacterium]
MLYDVVIVGGGVIGSAIARELMRYRLRAVLVEKECEVGFGTSKSNSGIIHAGHHSAPGTLKGDLEWTGNQMWDPLNADLDFGFKRIGELTVAMNEAQVHEIEALKRQGETRGVPGLEIWDRERTLKAEPNLTPDLLASLSAPTAGVINPYEACFSLVENACINGLELSVENPVLGITPEPDGTLTVKTRHGLYHTRFVINAAGVFADSVAAMVGLNDFRIYVRKGEEYLLDKRLEGFVQRLIFPCPDPVTRSKGILVIPTFDGTLMVGPTSHVVDDKDDLTTTSAGSDEVFDKVTQVVPGISSRDCIAEFAGLRAVADGEDFIIGPTAVKGFINVAGIQSPGLTAAPAIAAMVIDILRDEGLALAPNDHFIPTVPRRVRFGALPIEEKIRLADENPRYAHLICRCEHVSEQEILDAIHDGARTLDGVKFRTRAGMGRCQGGFCTWRIMELLAGELAIPISDVTKRGGGSWIIMQREEGEQQV